MPDSSPSDPFEDGAGEINAGELLARALNASHPTGKPRGWTPPTVEDLQRALPEYKISAIAGRGGMGAVYKGWQKSLDRHVAIKILPAEIEHGDADFAARFQREARAMARLNHPGIVAIHEAGETAEGMPYFVMDFIEGTDVQQMVATQGRLAPKDALAIVTQVCDALAYAHGCGIVHRDIKPSNVMVDAEGRVKIADFGLAKFTTAEVGPLTATDLTIGTPDFMAPEARRPGAQVDHRADLYAVGVMLYQMLTGELPHGRFAPPSRAVPGLDRRLDRVVDRALQPDPAARYQSAGDLRAAIAPASSSAPAVSRRKLAAFAGAAALLALAAGASWFWPGGGARNSTTQKTAPAAPRATPEPKPADLYPRGRWTPVDIATAASDHPVRGDAEGWWRVPGWKTFKPPQSKGTNWGVRATFRGRHTGTKMPELLLRDGEYANYNAFLHGDGSAITIQRYDGGAENRYQTLATRPLPQPILPGTSYTLEFIAVGKRLRLRLGDTTLEAVAPVPPVRGRGVIYGADHDDFRDVSILNLDGFPEAEARKLAGME